MQQLTRLQALAIGAGLALLMAATRVPAVPDTVHVFGASWAVFFLAGFYLRSKLALPALLALAVALDGLAIGWMGVASLCLTPAYAMLAPAYAALWAAGRWYASRHRMAWSSLTPLLGAALVGTLVCEAFSSGSFYWTSGVFTDPNWAEFAARELRYYPAYLASFVGWTALVGLLHVGIAERRSRQTALDAAA